MRGFVNEFVNECTGYVALQLISSIINGGNEDVITHSLKAADNMVL